MRSRRGTLSQGSIEKPVAQFIRFTEESTFRIHAAIKRDCRRSVQTFIHDATMDAVAESEKKAFVAKEARAFLESEKQIEPKGFALRDRLDAMRTQEPSSTPNNEPPPQDAPPPQSIVINNHPAAETSRVDILAMFVASAKPAEREDRLKHAAMFLSETAKDDAERAALAKQLDEKIVALTGTPTPSAPSTLAKAVDWFFGPSI